MSNKLKVLIIDDEQDAVGFINSIINEFCPKLEVIGKAHSSMEGVRAINELHPDLIFLDVEMPHGSGFDLLTQFPEKKFDVVFITAFDHYALRAIKFSAVDFLLKPINIHEFVHAVDKVIYKRNSASYQNANFNALLENIKASSPFKLAVPTSEGMEYISTTEIIRIEADRSYCWFHLQGGKKMLISKNLKEFQKLLNDQRFFRPHNSHLINLEHVKKYIRTDGGTIEMSDCSQVPIARQRKDLFHIHMNRFLRL